MVIIKSGKINVSHPTLGPFNWNINTEAWDMHGRHRHSALAGIRRNRILTSWVTAKVLVSSFADFPVIMNPIAGHTRWRVCCSLLDSHSGSHSLSECGVGAVSMATGNWNSPFSAVI